MQDKELATVETVALSESEARELTSSISSGLLNTWTLVKQAYIGRVWEGMKYASWQDWCDSEFGDKSYYRLRLPREDRKEVVASLRDAGLSIRAINSVTGLAKDTITNDLADAKAEGVLVKDSTITGVDGKHYPAESTAVQTKPSTEPAPAKEAVIRPATKPSKFFDYNAPSDKPKGGNKARTGKLRITMAVTHIYEVDLDSVSYQGIKSLNAAADVDVEGVKEDPVMFIQAATEDGAEVIVEYKWI